MAPIGVLIVTAIVSSGERTAHNGFGVEGLGPGGFYSLSYERIAGDRLSLRLGFSAYFAAAPKASWVTVPATVTYLAGPGPHFFEVGGGATFAHLQRLWDDERHDDVAIVGIVAYRYAPWVGGGTVRIGFMPVVTLRTGNVFPWVGLLLGEVF
jgi:hypothetical protein